MGRRISVIVSASRRTDIPAFYADWLFNRLREGRALVRNPHAPRRVAEVSLRPEDVDCFVFWTKDPSPMLPRLGELKEYPYYFQYTLNPYGAPWEPGLPSLEHRIDAFRRLADAAGPRGVVWRYDPVLLGGQLDTAYHAQQFRRLAGALRGYTHRCTISFVDFYSSVRKKLAAAGVAEAEDDIKLAIAKDIAAVASNLGMEPTACAEPLDLAPAGVAPARCIDAELIEAISGRSLPRRRDRNQRPGCRCAESVDIGAYGTCGHGCVYCYANVSKGGIYADKEQYDPASPVLCSGISILDEVKTRSM